MEMQKNQNVTRLLKKKYTARHKQSDIFKKVKEQDCEPKLYQVKSLFKHPGFRKTDLNVQGLGGISHTYTLPEASTRGGTYSNQDETGKSL